MSRPIYRGRDRQVRIANQLLEMQDGKDSMIVLQKQMVHRMLELRQKCSKLDDARVVIK